MNPMIDVIAFCGVLFGLLVGLTENNAIAGIILIGASLMFPIIVEEKAS